MSQNIEGAIRLDDPRIPRATSLVGLLTHGMLNGKTVAIPSELLGDDSYDVAVKAGFTGTPEEWLETLKGKSVELQKTATHIQWRVVGDDTWLDLILLTDIEGDSVYYAEAVAPAGTLLLKHKTETVINTALTSANTFTVELPIPLSGKVNESVLIFKTGASVPTITLPAAIAWRGRVLTLEANKSYTIVFEQIYFGADWEIWVTGVENA